MEVRFRTVHLRKCFESQKLARRAWGAEVARRYVERVLILSNSRNATDLTRFPSLRFHPLEGTRQGQYAVTLVGRYRLIITFEDKAMEIVCVEEVSKHYGD